MSMLSAIAYMNEVLSFNYKDNTSGYRVRTLRPNEPLPALSHHFGPDARLPQPDWIWIVEQANEPIAMLIAAPAQNIAFLMSLCASTDLASANTATLRLLLRTALADIHARGYSAFWVHLDPTRPLESKLLEIVRKLGDKASVQDGHSLAIGPTNLGAL